MIRSCVGRFGRVMVAALVALYASGCVTKVDGITLVSTRNVDMAAVHAAVGERVEKTERRFWLLFIPFGGEPNAKDVTTELLETSHADYLRNVRYDFGGWSLIAFSYGWVTVAGDPWRAGDASAPVSSPAP